MIVVEEKKGLALFDVRVSPGAAHTRVVGEHDGALKVSVSAAPEKGKANKALIALLAKALGVPKASLSVVSGVSSRSKRITAAGVGSRALGERLARLVEDAAARGST